MIRKNGTGGRATHETDTETEHSDHRRRRSEKTQQTNTAQNSGAEPQAEPTQTAGPTVKNDKNAGARVDAHGADALTVAVGAAAPVEAVAAARWGRAACANGRSGRAAGASYASVQLRITRRPHARRPRLRQSQRAAANCGPSSTGTIASKSASGWPGGARVSLAPRSGSTGCAWLPSAPPGTRCAAAGSGDGARRSARR